MVTKVHPINLRRRSTSKSGVQTHVFAWRVTTDNPKDGTKAAMFADGIPRDGDTLDGDQNTIVTNVDVQPDGDNPFNFIVEVTYTGNQFSAIQVHPLDRPPDYSQSGDSSTENYFMDESVPPKPYVNSAGDSFETLGERDGGDLTLMVTMNLAYWTIFDSDQYRRTTNSDIVFIDGIGYGPGALKMGVITSTKTQEVWQGTNVEFYRVAFPIKARKDGWKDMPLDFGYNTIKQVTKSISGVDTLINVKVPIVDSAGLKVTKAYPLDGTGRAKPSATDTPATLTFIPYKSVAWGSIGLR